MSPDEVHKRRDLDDNHIGERYPQFKPTIESIHHNRILEVVLHQSLHLGNEVVGESRGPDLGEALDGLGGPGDDRRF